jgi:uncharacterized membrane protein YczE
VSLALMVWARLGFVPRDALHQGIARHLGVRLGRVTIGVSGLVLLAWIPLRQRPGLGTISNAITVGLVVNGALTCCRAGIAGLARRVACCRHRAEWAGNRLLHRRRPWLRAAGAG